LCRVVLREGTSAERSADHVLNQLYRNWMRVEGEAPQVADVRFAQQRARAVTWTMVEAQDIRERGRQRAQFAHFSGDLTLYSRHLDALAAFGRGQLADFHNAYLNRERARFVLVRPTPPERLPPEARTGIGETRPDALGSVDVDVASIPRIAIPVGFGTHFAREVLGNGMIIESAHRGTTSAVAIGLTFRGGTAEEPQPGASALALMAASPEPLHGRFEDHGAVLTASATSDAFTFRVYTSAAHLGPVLEILADHVKSLRIRGRTVADLDRYYFPYVRRRLAQPESVANRAFHEALFANHMYSDTGDFPESGRPEEGAGQPCSTWRAASRMPASRRPFASCAVSWRGPIT
jgi:zinc protease